MRNILLTILLLFISVSAWAANPITGYTPYTANSGLILTNGNWSYSNGCINKAGSNYYVTYSASIGVSVNWPNLQNCFASAPTSSFPGALSITGNCLPQPPSSGVDSCSSYFQSAAEPYIVYDPVNGVWHAFVGDALSSTSYQNIAHLYVSGSADTFPQTGWTYEACQISSIGAAGQYEWTTQSVAPLAGGGWIMYVGGYNTGPVVNGNSLTQGMYYMTNTTQNYPSTGWSTPVLAMGGTSWSNYVEFEYQFVYGNKFYILANTGSGSVGGTYYVYLYSSSTQQFSSFATESTNALSPFPYITGLAGYSLNSGSMVGTSDVSFVDMDFWKGLGAFTITAIPISNPQPVLSEVSSSLLSGTLIVTGSVALGNGSTPLWEVGLYNSTQNIRSQATWSSWGANLPGTVSNTFSGTITANQGDSITVTAYDVGLESSMSTFTAPAVGSTYTISGTVSGAVQSGVTVNLTGTSSASTTTAGDGTYSFTGLSAGSYTITPSKTGYTFSPASLSETVTSSNITGANFTASVIVTSFTGGMFEDGIFSTGSLRN